MNYKEVRFSISSGDLETAAILVALLSSSGFESFLEEEGTLFAYIPEKDFHSARLEALLATVPGGAGIHFEQATIPDRNWNVLWERNFEPVVIDRLCRIRAPFHEEIPGFRYDLLIEPKMSFGTGHHATTSLMISGMLKLGLENLRVLDMGCGTGILAILASKMSASRIIAIDNEEWAYTNTIENAELNHAARLQAFLGDASLLQKFTFDLILANINLNILRRDLPLYAAALANGGKILLSGFFETDLPELLKSAQLARLKEIGIKAREKWASLLLYKPRPFA